MEEKKVVIRNTTKNNTKSSQLKPARKIELEIKKE